uniref:Uncharacterized protein n=1 Tax=Clytia hemisphaerica TaxID=252671 RepID=A0A7M5U9L0_9CNID
MTEELNNLLFMRTCKNYSKFKLIESLKAEKMWSFMIVVCGVFFSTVSGGQIYPSNEVQSVALNSDFHKNWTIQTAPNEEAKSIILYYHSGEKDPKVAWHGSVTKLGKSTFNRSLNVNIIENTEVVVEFSNIQEAMVLYLMVHFVDDKSGEMHAFYSNVKIVLKVNGEWANWGSWNACRYRYIDHLSRCEKFQRPLRCIKGICNLSL